MKRSAGSKRTTLPRSSDISRAFFKDWERLSRSGRFDLTRLKEVMLLLIPNDGPLGAEWQDHPLKGNWVGFRECHMGGDFLLVYKLDNETNPGTIILVRAGTHAELFE
ncbi:MAG: Addiction module toxin (RelE) [Leptospirillum rubarum]|nr:MAG: Addiction module toxin (RelE) [Leptospirillum rubarum]